MLTILCGDALEQLRTLPSESVQCCVTSPPYWGLRDYGTATWEGGDDGCDHSSVRRNHNGEIQETSAGTSRDRITAEDCKCGARRIDSQVGLEKTPEEYVAKMVEMFREVRRVLRKDGTLWLNLGDSYAIDFKGSGGPSEKQLSNPGSWFNGSRLEHGLKAKDLCGIPWRVAFALQSDGWWLRSDIIWAKPNPMPESVTDRPTKSHEYLFLLTKASSYYYDAEAIKEQAEYRDDARPFGNAGGNRHGDEESIYDPRASWKGSSFHLGKTADHQLGRSSKKHGEFNGKTNALVGREAFRAFTMTRNKRSVWTVATAPYPDAHFATYPPDLVKPCIMAGSRVGDTVLDLFAGSGTTGMVALELGRKAVLIELNAAYVKLIEQRCDVTLGLQLA